MTTEYPASSGSATALSIGMPVFNGARWLRAALDSLLAQSFTDFELIISDNASTDESSAICHEYVRRDNRIRYTKHDANIGVSNNFVFVLRQAKGKWFMWAACDDVWERDFIGTLLATHDTAPAASLVFSSLSVITEGRTESLPQVFKLRGLSRRALWPRFLAFMLQDPGSGKANLIYGIMRRDWALSCDALERCPLFGQDLLFLQQLLAYGPFVVHPEVLFYKRSGETAGNRPLPYLRWMSQKAALARRMGLIAWRSDLSLPLRISIGCLGLLRFIVDTARYAPTPLLRNRFPS
jgi:glycosyltransferase involved in cell wall biosynthesis